MSARRYTRPRNLHHLLDRLADQLDARGQPAAPITLWSEQYAEAHTLLHYALLSGKPLMWRGHPLICAEESKP
jgi:hypothetical protein